MTRIPTIDAPPPLSTARTRTNSLHPLVRLTAEGAISVAFVIAVYEVLVAGELRIWPDAPDTWILPVWVLAATVSGLGLNSVRRLARALVHRAWPSAAQDPYAALAAAVAGARRTAPAEDALKRLEAIAVEGTGAWSAVLRRLPCESRGTRPQETTFEIRAEGRVLGALVLTAAPGRPLTKAERQLAESLADAAGAVLRNTELTEQLAEQLRRQQVQTVELDQSRRRIVAARDDARELLGREIQEHVGEPLNRCAQQTAELSEDADTAEWKPSPAQLSPLTELIDTAIKDFRRIVHGVYPATLTDHGLTAALGNLVADLPGQATFAAPTLPRFAPRYEAGIYFCTAALVAPFETDTDRTLRLEIELNDDVLTVRVSEPRTATDHGARWDSTALDAIRDRVAALDGTLRLGPDDGGTGDEAGSATALRAELVISVEAAA